jgi:hypothetical protein
MSTNEQLAQRYIALWNETDPAARRRGVEELWSVDGRLRSVLGFLDRVPAGSAA